MTPSEFRDAPALPAPPFRVPPADTEQRPADDFPDLDCADDIDLDDDSIGGAFEDPLDDWERFQSTGQSSYVGGAL